MRIVIVGAGVAGSILARGLSRIGGIEVTCLERARREDHNDVGTGLNICPNAVLAFRRGDPDLASALERSSLPWKNWRVSLTSGEVLLDMPLRSVAECDGWRIRWAELYRVLRAAADPFIRYGCKVERIGEMADGSGRTFVSWQEDGEQKTIEDIDLLVAADGRFSKVREAFCGPLDSRQMGIGIYRLLVPDTSNGLIDDYEQWFNGPNRLLAYRVQPGHVYINGTFPIPVDAEVSSRQKSQEALEQAYLPTTGEPSDSVRWLIDETLRNCQALHWARVQESTVRLAEPNARVLYLGDSSNGMVPTLAQGATQAVEGAYGSLTVIMRRLAAGDEDTRAWCDEIVAKRTDRINFAMELSRDASDTILGSVDAIAGSRRKDGADFRAKLARLYGDIGEIDPIP